MIIQDGKILYDKDGNIKIINTVDYSVHYKGLIFVSGEKSGQQSIEYIIKHLITHKKLQFSEIYGNFFIYIIDHKNGKQYVFTDNSGVFKAYKYKNCISTSFLELLDYFDEITLDNLDYSSITEFFHYGFSYLENTLIKDIKRISSKDFFIYEGNILHQKVKEIGNIDSPPSITIEDFFSDLIYATKDLNTSIDITGGFDTQLIASFFHKAKSKFELAISGLKNNSDIRIGAKIAAIIKKDFYPTLHSTAKLPVEELYDIFEISDSQLDIIDYHRNNQLNNDRQARNVELQISGSGGELYKDFWWLQDFPFYNKTKTNVHKLYNYRIEGTAFPHSILGSKLFKKSLALRENTISKLKSFVQATNTQSYDSIYYNYKIKTNAGVYISTANNYFTSYAPLLELELVKLGYNLQRKERFFNNYHRKIISNNCPEISRVKTTEGITSSSAAIDIIFDSGHYVLDKAKRLLKQLLRKLLRKTYLQESPTDNYIYTHWKSHDLFKSSIENLKEVDILANDIDADKIDQIYIGKILTLNLLIERLKK